VTYVMIVTSQGTPCQIWGHQWVPESSFEVVLPGTVASAQRTVPRRLEDHATTAVVETPQEVLRWIKDATGLADGDIGDLLGVSRPTLNAWRRGEHISTPRLRRLYATRDVLQRAAARLPAGQQLRAWLVIPRGADSRTPEELLRAGELDRVRLLAMSLPPERISRPPDWVRQPVPATWEGGTESRQIAELPDDEQDVPAVPRTKGTRRVVLTRRGE